MNWRSLAATATREGLDELEALLWDAGAVSVTVEDGGENPLFEPGPGEIPVWEKVVATGLFEDGCRPEAVKEVLVTADFDVAFIDEVQDREWEREWLSRFEPMRFGQRLWVCPSGHQVAEHEAIVMHLDPGLAFGTGTHPTTRLCLEWLDANTRARQRVMDFGCGSGILGIAAILLGADEVVGVDNDPQALQATFANAARNGVEDRIRLYLPEDSPAGEYRRASRAERLSRNPSSTWPMS
ncbi:MAG: 50S ribosomal protein L11 methyltransferase [Gammaproteobacteria bacterium]|nr:50S ribosomal protein L11 methyltransferase [Gammaproteobacteria bacterium]